MAVAAPPNRSRTVRKAAKTAPPGKVGMTELEAVEGLQKLVQASQWMDAWNAGMEIIAQSPKNWHAHYLTGVAAMNMGNHMATLHLVCTGRVLAEAVGTPPAGYYDTMAAAFGTQGSMDEAIGCTLQAMRLDPQPWRYSNLIFNLSDYDSIPADRMRDAQKEFASLWRPEHCTLLTRDLDPHRRLKIGYVGSDFHRHSAQYIFGTVFFAHDHDKFHVTCYAGRRERDEVTDAYEHDADEWVPTYDMNDVQLAERINSDRIDILVDLSGHSAGNRLVTFAMKPAPIQVHAWGYLVGTGLPEMDYVFGDDVVSPTDWAKDYLVEKPWNLPCCVGFNPPRDAPAVGELPELTNGYRTYGYLGRASKITPAVIAEWADILNGDPTSKLMIKSHVYHDAGTRTRIEAQLWGHSVDAKRIIVREDATQRMEHLAVYNEIDIALDTFPVGGGVTTLEASWMGVPTVTKPREWMPSRIGTSIMKVLGYDGHDPHMSTERLQKIRAELRGRMNDSVICSPARYAAAVETAYRGMWMKYVDENR